MNLKHLFRGVNVQEERDYERGNVEAKRQRYLKLSPADRYRDDDFYRLKVDRIRTGLSRKSGELPKGYILDIGGNTAGEATVLQQEGAQFVVGDVNEIALEISKERVEHFELKKPGYCVLDVHVLPFADDSFDAITVIEALHHFPNYKVALKEIHRVLKPGGQFVSIEPNGLSPLRRLSEVRDRLRGTVEKSFYKGQLERLLGTAGFTGIDVEALPTGKSKWKMEEVPFYRRGVAKLHGWLGENYPRYFGFFMIYATKQGELEELGSADWTESLREPGGKKRITLSEDGERWMAEDGKTYFPVHHTIPMLMEDDRRELDS
ncbi:methyltransferase domain-containing protein [Akkermansiaceae bacterium]|nr:methyltransferase domain-containing protein [Akkermansiaceae bacterium]MDC0286841.1 methyltransferase domain-containing protein [Akkermansiaceae bacterium]